MQTSLSRFFQSKGTVSSTPGATRATAGVEAGTEDGAEKTQADKKADSGRWGGGDSKKRARGKDAPAKDQQDAKEGPEEEDDDEIEVVGVHNDGAQGPASGDGTEEEKATPSKRGTAKGLAALSPQAKRAKVSGEGRQPEKVSAGGMEFEPSVERQQRFIKKLALAAAAGEEGTAGAGGGDSASRGRIGSKPTSKYTSLEQQVLSLKRAHPDLLLMVEVGYRFRFFAEDALEAAKVLGVYSYIDHNFYVASVPTVRVKVHLRRLVEAGHKVGIVRQMETAALKAAGLSSSGNKSGTFERKVVAIFTSSTFNEDDPALAFVQQSVATKAAPSSASSASGGSKGGGKQGKLSFGKAQAAEEEQQDQEEEDEEEGMDDEEEGGGAGGGGAGVALGERSDGSTAEAGREQWMMCIVEEERLADSGDSQEQESKAETGAGSSTKKEEAGGVTMAVVAVNAKTGVLVYDTFRDGPQRMELDTRLRQLAPVELLLPSPSLSKASEACVTHFQGQAVDASGRPRVTRVERIPASRLDPQHASKTVSTYLHKLNPDDQQAASGTKAGWSELPDACHRALGPLIEHVKAFGIERILAKPDLRPFSTAVSMTLDGVTLRDLEIFSSQPEGKEQGSLFKLLDRTLTAFGQRRLREWVRRPLVRLEQIRSRLDAVEELAFDPPACLEGLCDRLKKLPDIEAIVTTLHTRRVSPKRLVLLLTAVQEVLTVLPTATEAQAQVKAAAIHEVLGQMPKDLLQSIQDAMSLLDQEAAKTENKVDLFTDPAFFPRLTSKKEGLKDVELALQDELQEIRKLLRKPSLTYRTLRTGVNSYTEFLIELKKSEANGIKGGIPSDWSLVSQTKDFVRYHTPKVLGLMRKLLVQREEMQSAGEEAWRHYVAMVDDSLYASLRSLLSALASFDAYLSLSKVAKLPGYVKPTYEDEGEGEKHQRTKSSSSRIHLVAGRHPVLEQALEGRSPLVPNDVDLGVGRDAKDGCLIVSGPNMGGKSSYVRMVALLCIMGQIGSYVPAEAANLCLLDGVYTRMGAGDDLVAGMSTFLLELWNTSFILDKATSRSLVILDELGRGTATYDGMAIAEATVRYLVKHVGCPCLFVTHYPQLSELSQDAALRCRDGSPRVRAGHMAFYEKPADSGASSHNKYDITFLYQMVEGGAGASYGLNVAKLAGLDDELLKVAASKSRELQIKVEGILGTTDTPPAAVAASQPRAEDDDEGEANAMEVVEDDEAGELIKAFEQVAKDIEEADLSGVSQKEYMRRKREVLQTLLGLQERARQAAVVT